MAFPRVDCDDLRFLNWVEQTGGFRGPLGAVLGRLGAVSGGSEAILCRLDAPADSKEGEEAIVSDLLLSAIVARISAKVRERRDSLVEFPTSG